MKFKNQNYPILIAPTHIPELNAVEHTTEGIRFGASVTLTTLEDVLDEATHTMPGTELIKIQLIVTKSVCDLWCQKLWVGSQPAVGLIFNGHAWNALF